MIDDKTVIEQNIPKQLRKKEYRFTRCKAGSKEPIDNDWPNTGNFQYDDPLFVQHLREGGNWGNVGEFGGLAGIDADTQPVADTINKNLPSTFKVISPGHKAPHFYYICKDLTKSMRLSLPDQKAGSAGDVQWKGKQLIGPGSTHPNGGKYVADNDLEIATVTAEQIKSALSAFIKKESACTPNTKNTEHTFEITKIINTAELIEQGDELQGPHPKHGSETGKNFCVNPTKNLWHCFRHETGGDAWSLFAVLEGLLPCENAVKGAIPKEMFKELLTRAGQKGLIKYDPNLSWDKIKYAYKNSTGQKKERLFEREECWQMTAEILKQIFYFKTIQDTKELMIYEEGIYVLKGELIIEKTIQHNLSGLIKTNDVIEVINIIKRGTYINRDEFDKDINLLCLKNGVINIITAEFKNHNPSDLLSVKIPVSYKKDQDCPKIKQFISQIVATSDVATIEELIGYCLYRTYFIQVSFLFIAEGSNGKSTLINLIRKFLGEENIAAVPIQDLDGNRFASARLHKKLANLYPDLSKKALLETGKFKMSVGGDKMPAEKKFKDGFEFVNYAKEIYSTNTVPRAVDPTRAFYRRWIMTLFPNTFSGTTDNKNIIEEITTDAELSGLLNLALVGLKRLLDKKNFTYSRTIEQNAVLYQRLSDPVKAFVDDCVILKADGWVIKEELYAGFSNYCKRNKLLPIPNNKFTDRLQNAVENVCETRKTLTAGTPQVRCWQGICWPDIRDIVKQLDSKNEGIPEQTLIDAVCYNGPTKVRTALLLGELVYKDANKKIVEVKK